MNNHYVIENHELRQYRGPEDATELVVPEGVVSISGSAFAPVKHSLRRITLPATLTSINPKAFAGFRHLEQVVFSGHNVTIGEKCFFDCRNLSGVSGTEGIVKIGAYGFSKTNLQTVDLPNVEDLGISAFEQCPRLQTVALSEKTRSIPSGCFAYCQSLTSVQIPEGLQRIAGEAFSGSPVPCLHIPASVKKIEIRSYRNNSTFEPATRFTVSAGNPYYEVSDHHLVERPYHEEGGLYTVVGEPDPRGRCIKAHDASREETYYLRQIRYSQEELDRFREICGKYRFSVHEQWYEGNDDLNLETETSERDYFADVSMEDVVIRDHQVVGFLCDRTLMRTDDPGARAKKRTPSNSLSYYRYEYSIQVFTLLQNEE